MLHPDKATTILAFITAMLNYWGQVGFAPPRAPREVAIFCGAIGLIALGYLINKR